ncbi:MAG: hypothetical protein AB7D49_12840, partial [Arcobacter sp.]|uniref:hypothetical protein n=1 Tax=Arcobacter sp. TaxID=1872629 RepID=UPI003D11FBD1
NALIEEKEKNKKKDFLLFQQSKLSTIGELLGNIVHQWRQPLNGYIYIKVQNAPRFLNMA